MFVNILCLIFTPFKVFCILNRSDLYVFEQKQAIIYEDVSINDGSQITDIWNKIEYDVYI